MNDNIEAQPSLLKKFWNKPSGKILLIALPIVLIFILFSIGREVSSELPVSSVHYGDFIVSITETGELRATNSNVINAPPIRTNLQIVYLAPKGEEVKEGDTLVVFDGTELKTMIDEKKSELEIAHANINKSRASMASNIAQLKASLRSSEASYRQAELRLQQMQFEADVVKEEQELALLQSEINLEQARERLTQQITIDSAETRMLELRVEQAQGDVTKAERDLGRLTLLAPQPGLVVYKKIWKGGGFAEIKIGDSPWRGQALIELPDLSQMEVTTAVNEVDVSRVESGQSATIVLDAFPEREFSGTVFEVSNLARTDEEKPGEIKVFDVIIHVENTDPILKPGMTVSATIIVETIPDVLSVPLDAVFNEGNRKIAYVKEKGFEAIDIVLGKRNDNFVVVEEGLTGKEHVSLIDPNQPFDAAIYTGTSQGESESSSSKSSQKKSETTVIIQ
ncbi:efflux RND transporter periplasmic adaptor subunit [bacterium]|nr:efflux RND transporter periplasmic adaptor subunit [bacterium]